LVAEKLKFNEGRSCDDKELEIKILEYKQIDENNFYYKINFYLDYVYLMFLSNEVKTLNISLTNRTHIKVSLKRVNINPDIFSPGFIFICNYINS
jgi:hypothetical protein